MQCHGHALITYDYKWKKINHITLDGCIKIGGRQSAPHSTLTPSTELTRLNEEELITSFWMDVNKHISNKYIGALNACWNRITD